MEPEKHKFIKLGSHKGKGLAVFTSGGDSQGNSNFYALNLQFRHGEYGVVNFFLVPENMEIAQMMFGSEEIPYYYNDLIKFYKSINQTSLAQGIDIRLILFNEGDRIFDVRDKILKILKNEYEI